MNEKEQAAFDKAFLAAFSSFVDRHEQIPSNGLISAAEASAYEWGYKTGWDGGAEFERERIFNAITGWFVEDMKRTLAEGIAAGSSS